MVRSVCICILAYVVLVLSTPKSTSLAERPRVAADGAAVSSRFTKEEELPSGFLDTEEFEISETLKSLGVAPDSAHSWAPMIIHYAEEVGVTPRLLVAVAYHESRLNPRAYNPNDPSWGLFQVMPIYWGTVFVEECGRRATPTTLLIPRVSICYGAHVLAEYRSKFPEDSLRALRAYNNGTGRHNGYDRQVVEVLTGIE